MYGSSELIRVWIGSLMLAALLSIGHADDRLQVGRDIRRLPPVLNSREIQLTAFQDESPPVAFQDEGDYLAGLEELAGPPPTASYDGPNPIDSTFEGDRYNLDVGDDFYAPPEDFTDGLVIYSNGVAMKFSGYVKVDLIHDYDPIGSKDLFDTTTIPVDALPRQNTRYHARQSRFNFDVRWNSELGPVRVFVEGDFFGTNDAYRLRHAYGEVRNLIIGQTWTTFTSMETLPATLDFEGAVSSVSRRQAQVRWTQDIVGDLVTVAVAVENPDVRIELPEDVPGEPVTESPDFISRIRWSPEWGQFQIAGLVRELGVQPENGPVITDVGWGFNFTGALLVNEGNKVYYQILFGDGIGSYRGLPDVAPIGPGDAAKLGTFGWMVGWTHSWTERLFSNFTYSESSIDNLPGQSDDALRMNTYLAVNLIWNPIERSFMGIEYLFGTREDNDLQRGEANRVQISFGFFLP